MAGSTQRKRPAVSRGMLPEAPLIEFLLLADRAEAINGKLYLMGGAWDRLSIADFDQPANFSLALGVLVPWMATNEQYQLTIAVENEDGSMLEELSAGLVQGRPPHAVVGQSFRVLLALNGQWKFPSAGTYRITVRLSSGDTKSTSFYVAQADSAGTVAKPA